MKKLLLPVFLLFAVTYAQAQCVVGKHATYVYDDFSSGTEPTGPGDGGLYFWGGSAASSNVRDAANGELDLIVSQPYGTWNPFGISFGDVNGDGTGAPYTIDLSSNATFSVSVRNDHATTTVNFRMVIQDVNDNNIDTDPKYAADGGGFSNAWKYPIDIPVAPGQTVTMTLNSVNASGTALSGTYVGGAESNWTTGAFETDADLTKIKGILFYVTNNSLDAANSYAHYGFSDLSLSITDLRIGACPLSIFPKTISNAGMKIAPNPASEVVNISYAAEAGSNVKVNVTDVMGNVVKTVEGSSSSADINVADLNKGVYFVTVLADGTPVTAQKLVVE